MLPYLPFSNSECPLYLDSLAIETCSVSDLLRAGSAAEDFPGRCIFPTLSAPLRPFLFGSRFPL